MATTLNLGGKQSGSERTGSDRERTANPFFSSDKVGSYYYWIKMNEEQFNKVRDLVAQRLWGLARRVPSANRGAEYYDKEQEMQIYVQGFSLEDNDFVKRKVEGTVKMMCKKLGIKHEKPLDEGPIFYDEDGFFEKGAITKPRPLASTVAESIRRLLRTRQVEQQEQEALEADSSPRSGLVAALLTQPSMVLGVLASEPGRLREAAKRANNEVMIMEEEQETRAIRQKEYTNRILSAYAEFVAEKYKDDELEAATDSILRRPPDAFSTEEGKEVIVGMLSKKAKEISQEP